MAENYSRDPDETRDLRLDSHDIDIGDLWAAFESLKKHVKKQKEEQPGQP